MNDRYISLEEGVDWDTKKKVLRPTNTYMAKALNRADTISRIKKGLLLGANGAFVGAGYGLGSKWGPIGKHIAGGVLGGGVLGGVGYAIGGIKDDPTKKKITSDRILEKLEKQYQNRIDEIEGW